MRGRRVSPLCEIGSSVSLTAWRKAVSFQQGRPHVPASDCRGRFPESAGLDGCHMTQPENNDLDPEFFQLVSSLHSAAMLQMGKIINPLTGKIERHMELARNTIDLLGMLQAKTTGNLSTTEREYLDHVLHELRMNYVDEIEHPTAVAGSSSDTPPSAPTPEPSQSPFSE